MAIVARQASTSSPAVSLSSERAMVRTSSGVSLRRASVNWEFGHDHYLRHKPMNELGDLRVPFVNSEFPMCCWSHWRRWGRCSWRRDSGSRSVTYQGPDGPGRSAPPTRSTDSRDMRSRWSRCCSPSISPSEPTVGTRAGRGSRIAASVVLVVAVGVALVSVALEDARARRTRTRRRSRRGALTTAVS